MTPKQARMTWGWGDTEAIVLAYVTFERALHRLATPLPLCWAMRACMRANLGGVQLSGPGGYSGSHFESLSYSKKKKGRTRGNAKAISMLAIKNLVSSVRKRCVCAKPAQSINKILFLYRRSFP